MRSAACKDVSGNPLANCPVSVVIVSSEQPKVPGMLRVDGLRPEWGR